MKTSSTFSRERVTPVINKFRKVDGKFSAVKVCKTTIATELAKEAGTLEVKLPEWYQEFSSVFSEEAHCFPPSRSCDHTINLDDSFVPKVGKIYPLTPKEQKATEVFLEENLQLGRICPSKSPQATSFFFVDKKDASNALWPCQDYWYVNDHTIKDAYPLPLVQNLTYPTLPPLNPIPLEQTLPFKQISYDLITGLPLSNGFDALLVVVDHSLSKGVILCPTKKSITADGIAAIIFQKLYACFGLFDKVILDRDPQFTANFAKELSCILRYKISLSMAYHPPTDGETERLNQEVETYPCIRSEERRVGKEC